METDSIAIRLKLFMDKEGITNSQLADSCGIPRPTVSQLLNGRNKKISDVFITLLHSTYPQLSIMWLLFGDGEMYSLSNEFDGDRTDNIESDSIFSDSPFVAEYEDNTPENRAFSDKGYDSRQRIPSLMKSGIESGGSGDIKPRKVVSITVFYDDNSYEVFSPSSQKKG